MFPYCILEGKRFLTEILYATVVTGFICLRYCIFFQHKKKNKKNMYPCFKQQPYSTCGVRGCKVPVNNLDGPTRNLQNIDDKH